MIAFESLESILRVNTGIVSARQGRSLGCQANGNLGRSLSAYIFLSFFLDG